MPKPPKRTTIKDRVNPGETQTYMAISSDKDSNYNVHLKWGRLSLFGVKDLAIRVTAPDERQYGSNTPHSAAETLTLYGPLLIGTYVLEIINLGTKSVRFTLTHGFTSRLP